MRSGYIKDSCNFLVPLLNQEMFSDDEELKIPDDNKQEGWVDVYIITFLTLLLVITGYFIPDSSLPTWQNLLLVDMGFLSWKVIKLLGYRKSTKVISLFGLTFGLELVAVSHFSTLHLPPPFYYPIPSSYLRDIVLFSFVIFLARGHKTIRKVSIKKFDLIFVFIGILFFILFIEKDSERIFALSFYLGVMVFIMNEHISLVYFISWVPVLSTYLLDEGIYGVCSCPMIPFLEYSPDLYYTVLRLKILTLCGLTGSDNAMRFAEENLINKKPDSFLPMISAYTGFAGTAIVVLLYFLLICFCMRLSFKAKNAFSAYLSFGMTCYLAYNILNHLFWVTNMAPGKGGTGLSLIDHRFPVILSMIALGLIINCAKEEKDIPKETYPFIFNKKRGYALFFMISVAFFFVWIKLYLLAFYMKPFCM